MIRQSFDEDYQKKFQVLATSKNRNTITNQSVNTSSIRPTLGYTFTQENTGHLNYSSHLTRVMCTFKSEKKVTKGKKKYGEYTPIQMAPQSI